MALKDVSLGFGIDAGPVQQINRELNNFNQNTVNAGKATQTYSSRYQREQRKMIKETQATNDALGRQSREMRQLAKTAGTNVSRFADEWGTMSKDMRKDLIRNNNALVKHRMKIQDVEHDMWKLGNEMGNYSGTTDDFMKSVNDLGKQHKKATDKMINNNTALRKSIVQQVGVFQARTTQSEKISKAYDDMGNSMLKLNKPFLSVSNHLNQVAKRGNAATLALKQLGPNASMKALQDRIRLINRGMMRYQMVAIAAAAGAAIFYSGLHKAARDSIPSYAAALEEMSSSVRRAFQPMVEVFAAVMTKVFNFIDSVADMIVKFNEAYPTLAKIIQGFLMLVPALTVILAPLSIGIGLFGGMQAAMAAMWPMIGPIVTGFAAMMGTVLAVAAGIAVLIGGFIAAYKHLDGFRNRVDNVVDGFRGFFAIIRGEEGKGASILSRIGLGPEAIKGIMNFGSSIRSSIDTVKNSFNTLKTVGQAAIAVFNGNDGKAVSMLARLGLGPDTIKNLIGTFNSIKSTVSSGLDAVWQFVRSMVVKVTSFWEENGQTIIQSIQNVASIVSSVVQGIWSVMKFVWPLVSALIQSVWRNIQGVISGAIDVIMGLVKVFSGLFTGNFSKMWEGIKQIFFGAIRFIWNFIQLQMFGKILSAGKVFFSGFRSIISSLWTTLRSLFSNGVSAVRNFVSTGFSKIQSLVGRVLKNIKDAVANRFRQIIDSAKALPGKIGSGIKSMAGKAWDGIKAFGNRMARGFGKIINGALSGVGWIMGKLGIDFDIPKWTPPQYAKGTNFHPGGPAIVGEEGRELIHARGQTYMADRPQMLNLPRGASVLPNPQTEMVLKGVPGYANGVGDFFGGVVNTAKKAVSKVKDIGVDVFSYITNPGKLVTKVLDKFGVSFPKDIGGMLGDFGRGTLSFIKNKAMSFVKNKMKDFGSMFSGKGGKVSGNVMQWLQAAIGATGVPGNWLSPLSVIAQHESGGNPRAQNNWDINAKRGIPSKGLMQTIGPTFNANKLPGMNDIFNPVHNAAAAIRYIQGRYGSVFNVPGIRNMSQGKPYVGYKNGTTSPLTKSQWAWVGEQGPELMHVPRGASIYSNDKSKKMSSGGYDPQINESHRGGSAESQRIVFSPSFILHVDANAKVDEETKGMLRRMFEELSEEQFDRLLRQMNLIKER